MGTLRGDAALLRQEVRELTELLRNHPDWASLRRTLASQNLNPADVLLISFCEDETEGEYGAFLTIRERRIFQYERSTVVDAPAVFTVWRELNPTTARVEYPTISEALRLLDDAAADERRS